MLTQFHIAMCVTRPQWVWYCKWVGWFDGNKSTSWGGNCAGFYFDPAVMDAFYVLYSVPLNGLNWIDILNCWISSVVILKISRHFTLLHILCHYVNQHHIIYPIKLCMWFASHGWKMLCWSSLCKLLLVNVSWQQYRSILVRIWYDLSHLWWTWCIYVFFFINKLYIDGLVLDCSVTALC